MRSFPAKLNSVGLNFSADFCISVSPLSRTARSLRWLVTMAMHSGELCESNNVGTTNRHSDENAKYEFYKKKDRRDAQDREE